MRMVCFFLLCGVLRAATYCDEPKEVSAALRLSRAQWESPLEPEAGRAEQASIPAELGGQFPDRIQGNRR